jgi:hypothetical protein
MIVAVNKEVDSSKREDSKIRRINTRSAIIVIQYNLIELRDILSRLDPAALLHSPVFSILKVTRKMLSTRLSDLFSPSSSSYQHTKIFYPT